MCFEPRERHIQIRLDELIWTNQFSANVVVLGLEFEGLNTDTCNLQATAPAADPFRPIYAIFDAIF